METCYCWTTPSHQLLHCLWFFGFVWWCLRDFWCCSFNQYLLIQQTPGSAARTAGPSTCQDRITQVLMPEGTVLHNPGITEWLELEGFTISNPCHGATAAGREEKHNETVPCFKLLTVQNHVPFSFQHVYCKHHVLL